MTPSTSSSSTGPSQGQPAQLYYTTAGTVYDPRTAVPLQPPARKGRASRWPPPGQADFALFNKSVPPGHPYRRSPPTTASSLKHYSPLQQNCDRAIEPSTAPNNLNSSLSDSPPYVSFASNPLGNMTGRGENTGQLGSMGLQYEDKEDEELARTVSNLGVKALTSLASYPNLHQQMAQRALDKAREAVKAAETSSAMSPNLQQRNFQRQQEGAVVVPLAMNPSREYGNAYGRNPRTGHAVGSTRSSVLSSGPGAPRPLTAGPPGQRQYKASTLEAPLRTLQGNVQRPSSTIDEAHFDINPSALVNLGRETPARLPSCPQTPYLKQQVPGSDHLDLGKPPLYDAFESVRPPEPARRSNRTRDTLPVGPLRGYFPRGFPSDYRFDPDSVGPFLPNGADLQLREGRFLPTPEMMRLRDARAKAVFYASAGELLKTIDERVTYADNKLQDMELSGDEARERAAARATTKPVFDLSRIDKPNPEFTSDFVNELPTHEAATPLISLAFATLLNYWDNGRLMSIPTGFEKMEDYNLGDQNEGMHGAIGQPNASRVVSQKPSS